MENKKFFLPVEDTRYSTEEMYAIIKDYLANTCHCPHTDDRIYQVKYTHNGTSYTDTVGEPANLEPSQKIIAIFRGVGLCYICTRDRGVYFDAPIMCRPDSIIYFAEQEE